LEQGQGIECVRTVPTALYTTTYNLYRTLTVWTEALGVLAIRDRTMGLLKRQELAAKTGSARTTRMYTIEQVEELIDDHPALRVKHQGTKGHLITWHLKECPLERTRSEQRDDSHTRGSEGNPCISYDPQTSTPMFYCFEAQCLALVEDEFEGIGGKHWCHLWT